jgi:hypothetical protein
MQVALALSGVWVPIVQVNVACGKALEDLQRLRLLLFGVGADPEDQATVAV